ncbi:hypothetical protein H2199_008167 [Coniosporium tulheliwenetii]|uniref:Uncharacterized protein n=1 Tax=Coniosporium tulheliwenetii TaxID=3383036 RepID=A0ACC2YKF6_9PEZI|nr:hypothetical protein H2199_008167 [Cladosporium sp. JES 115]
MRSPGELPSLRASIRLGDKGDNVSTCFYDVKFYPYVLPGEDLLFAVTGDKHTIICRPVLEKDNAIEILRWFVDEETNEDGEPNASLNSLEWTQDFETGEPLVCVTGSNPKIKLLNVCTGALVKTLTGHGSWVIPDLPNEDTGTDNMTIIHYPHFSTSEIHRDYRPPKTSSSPPTRSAFGARFQRLLQFEAPLTNLFYMRFGLFHAPEKHPILVMGNERSKLFFWDLQALEEGFEASDPQQHGRGGEGVLREESIASNVSGVSSNVGSVGVSSATSTGSGGERKWNIGDPFRGIVAHKSITVGKVTFATRALGWSGGGECSREVSSWTVMDPANPTPSKKVNHQKAGGVSSKSASSSKQADDPKVAEKRKGATLTQSSSLLRKKMKSSDSEIASPFLRLAQEIRDMIYSYVADWNEINAGMKEFLNVRLEAGREEFLNFDANVLKSYHDKLPTRTTPTIPLLCRQITFEALDVLRKKPLILSQAPLYYPRDTCCANYKCSYGLENFMTETTFQNVKTLVISLNNTSIFNRLRDWVALLSEYNAFARNKARGCFTIRLRVEKNCNVQTLKHFRAVIQASGARREDQYWEPFVDRSTIRLLTVQ